MFSYLLSSLQLIAAEWGIHVIRWIIQFGQVTRQSEIASN
jgi:hypothetical protein